MSEAARIEAKNYIEDDLVDEELHSGTDTIPASTTTALKVDEGTSRDGYDGVFISIACTQNVSIAAFLKIDAKQRFDNGLNAGGMGGLNEETLILEPIDGNIKWELGFTNTSGGDIAVSWRLRLRLFKKGK